MFTAKFEDFDPDKKRVLTVPEFGFRYGVGRTMAYELIRKGHVASIKVGGRRLVPVEEAEKFLANAMATS